MFKSLEKNCLQKFQNFYSSSFSWFIPDKRINFLAKKYKFKVIEDTSHSFGGKYRNEPIEIGIQIFQLLVFIL